MQGEAGMSTLGEKKQEGQGEERVKFDLKDRVEHG